MYKLRWLIYLLAATLMQACGSSDNSSNAETSSNVPTKAVAILELVSGDDQLGLLGDTLKPIIIRALDADGVPVNGAEVSFAITSGSGQVDVAKVAADKQGYAQTGLRLGTEAGALHIKASAAEGKISTQLRMTAVEPDLKSASSNAAYNSTWSEGSHGKSRAANTGLVLPQDKVNTIEIRMSAKQWASVKTDLKDVLDEAATRRKQTIPTPTFKTTILSQAFKGEGCILRRIDHE